MKRIIRLILGMSFSLAIIQAEEKVDLNSDINLADQEKVEERINLLIKHLGELRVKAKPVEVKDYAFKTSAGETTLSQFFHKKSKLLVIHNMGKECPYCTLWADGFTGLLPHLSDAMDVVLVSTDSPSEQEAFAKSRGWKFKMASHKDMPYTKAQTGLGEMTDMPGATVYEKIDGKIYLKNKCFFDPSDIYCPMWSFIGLAGIEPKDWEPNCEYKSK
jgi:predicted dithiol-disulfide oxidoreductase (DUF899 family)